MRYEEVLRALGNLSARGMDFGLGRTRGLLDGLGKPDKKLKIIHIAGTNGKGSVAEYITQILIADVKRVGTFTSPEVYGYLEQFRIDGDIIDKTLFCKAAEKALDIADNATKFEVETAIALYAFALAGCEYAVLECGLGGEYDATNAVSHKELALITSIALEHTAILGNTLESICTHKAGIIRNCPAIVSGYNEKSVIEFFKNYGAAVAGKYEDAPMLGEAQQYNAGLAIAAAKALGINETAVYSGIKRAKLGGRVEILNVGGVNYILDGAHNPQSFLPLISYLRNNCKAEETAIVYGCLADKDVNCVLRSLSGTAEEITAVEPESPRAMKLDDIYGACKNYFGNVKTAASVSDALAAANKKTVAVCGSFTILKEAKSWIGKRS